MDIFSSLEILLFNVRIPALSDEDRSFKFAVCALQANSFKMFIKTIDCSCDDKFSNSSFFDSKVLICFESLTL